jgi:hypothetical protein
MTKDESITGSAVHSGNYVKACSCSTASSGPVRSSSVDVAPMRTVSTTKTEGTVTLRVTTRPAVLRPASTLT